MSLHTAGPTSPRASDGECDIFPFPARGVLHGNAEAYFNILWSHSIPLEVTCPTP